MTEPGLCRHVDKIYSDWISSRYPQNESKGGKMAATVWSGVIGFGMVSIPVKLYSATSSKRISFHQLHKTCMSRIQEVRWCPQCDVEVPWEDVIKGYELSKDDYIPMTPEDFDQLPIPSKNLIDITSFTELKDVDPLYFEKNYYLLPDKKGEKAFALFLKALETKSLCAVGKIAIRSRERLCAIRATGGTMVLATLLYEDEIRVDMEADSPETKIAKPELDMALTLIDIMKQPFDPSSYKDDYNEAMTKLIEEKARGKSQTSKVKALAPKAAGDLMAALRESLESAGNRREGQGKSDKPDAKSAAKTVAKTATVTPIKTVRLSKAGAAAKAAPARKGKAKR